MKSLRDWFNRVVLLDDPYARRSFAEMVGALVVMFGAIAIFFLGYLLGAA